MSMIRARQTRRQFLTMAAGIAGAGILAACAPVSAPQPTAPAPAENTAAPVESTAAPVENAPAPAKSGGSVQYWVCWGANYTEAVWNGFLASDRWKELLDGTTVEVKGGSTEEPLLTAVAAGTPPDASSCFDYFDLMSREVLRPLDDWVSSSKVVRADNYEEPVWKMGFYKEKLYGVPCNGGTLTLGLIYNTRLVEKENLDPDKPPTTWDEALEWQKALTKFDDSGNLVQLGFNPYDAMAAYAGYDSGLTPAAIWGWTFYDENTGKFDLNNAKMAEAFDTYAEFLKLAGPDKVAGLSQSQPGFVGSSQYRAEVLAMMVDGSWRPGHTAKNKPEVSEVTRSSWVPMPASRKGVKLQAPGGNLVSIFRDAANPEGAFKLVEFLGTPEADTIMWNATGWVPVTKQALAAVDPKLYPGTEFFIKSAQEATEWHTPPRCPIYAYVGTKVSELGEAVYRGQMTGAQAAEELQKGCESEYKAGGFKP